MKIKQNKYFHEKNVKLFFFYFSFGSDKEKDKKASASPTLIFKAPEVTKSPQPPSFSFGAASAKWQKPKKVTKKAGNPTLLIGNVQLFK